MINEERVTELVHIAMYDQKAGEVQEQVKSYFKSDYIGKEIIKSFFSGTFAFIFAGVLYMLYRSPELVAEINSLDFAQIATGVLIVYVVFMVVYLFVTLLIYTVRYNKEFRQLKQYGERVKKLNKMYEREEKLRQ